MSAESERRVQDPTCDLCEAARITPWFHEDEVCWIAECELCATPMVVWRSHGIDPPADQLAHMHEKLAKVAAPVAIPSAISCSESVSISGRMPGATASSLPL